MKNIKNKNVVAFKNVTFVNFTNKFLEKDQKKKNY